MDQDSGVDYNPFDDEVLADPFSVYAEMRAKCPVHHFADFGDGGFYSVTRYADVAGLSKDVDRWSAEWGQGPIYVKEGGLRSDPPEHTVYRRLITGAFTPSRTAAMEPFIRATAEALLDSFIGDGRAELISAYASPLPLDVISYVLGVPSDRRDEFKSWSDEFMAGQNNADPEVQGAARAKIDAYFAAELDRRRALLAGQPDAPATEVLPDDVLTSLITAEHEGQRFTNEQLLPLLLLLLVGGNDTTTSLIGNLVRRLLELDLWETVASDPSCWDAVIEESLRLDPPVLGLFRTARGDQQIDDVVIPDRAKVHGLYASANRDPGVWRDPDEFRLDRTPAEARQHLSLGAGIWFCPGAQLARLEAKVSMELFASRLANLRIDGPVERTASFMMWGPRHLPLAFEPVR